MSTAVQEQTFAQLQTELQNAKKAVSAATAALYQFSKENQPAVQEDKVAARKAAKVAKYATKNGLTIHKLRLAGNEVKITHIRFTDIPGVATLVPVPSYMRTVYNFWPRGGATHIVITTPDGKRWAATSVCHCIDSFDYKLGVKEALDSFYLADAKELLSDKGANQPVV
ncbi:hypothetical protein [Acinetobacter sp.]|uniref:hypothetical protein n=1 Tax=Acinetobacter sp. TaxID=472 RepID=UPI0037520B7C